MTERWCVQHGKRPRVDKLMVSVRRRPSWTVPFRCVICGDIWPDEFHCGADERTDLHADLAAKDPFICPACLTFLPTRKAIDRSISWGDHLQLARLHTITLQIEALAR